MLSEEERDVTTFTDNDFHNIGIGIIRHNVVALAQQAEQMINSGHLEEVDRAAVGTDFSALGRFLISKKEADIAAFKTPDIRNILVTGPYLSPQYKEQGAKELARQREISRTNRPQRDTARAFGPKQPRFEPAPPVMWLYPPSLDRTRSGD